MPDNIDPNEYARGLLEDERTANYAQKLVLARIRKRMAYRNVINQKLRVIQNEVAKLQSEAQQATGALDEMAECLLDLRTEQLAPTEAQDTLPVIVPTPPVLPT